MSSFVHRRFSNPDAYAEAVRQARGIFNATVDAVDLEGTWLHRAHDTLARTVHVELKNARRVFMLLADDPLAEFAAAV